MKTKTTLATIMSLALLLIPTVSLANTYQFIDTSGNLQSVEARNSDEALATAYQLGVHSGVMLYTKGYPTLYTSENTPTVSTVSNTSSDNTGNYYQFIDTSGKLQGMWAVNATVALATAYQLGVHSGVVLGPI